MTVTTTSNGSEPYALVVGERPSCSLRATADGFQFQGSTPDPIIAPLNPTADLALTGVTGTAPANARTVEIAHRIEAGELVGSVDNAQLLLAPL